MNVTGFKLHQYNYSMASPVRSTMLNISSASSANQSCESSNKDLVNFTSSQNKNQLRTNFISKDEKAKYKDLVSIVDKDSKKKLNDLLKSGVLLNANSNDNSTVLENLYKIINSPRANGLDRKNILITTITALANPFTITQLFGDIPVEYQQSAISLYAKDRSDFRPTNFVDKKVAEHDVNIHHSGTCVAASIEFNMAKKFPAEFARFAEGLSSVKMSVDKTINLKNLADNTLDAVWLLNAFEIPYETKDFDKAKLTFKPDKNAIFRAYIQSLDRGALERSVIDVLMQSTFMQTGSQQSYDTLTDKRKGKFNQNDKGLIEFEKTFTESVVEDKNKISVTYQTIDENAKLVGYETDFKTMKNQIVKSLKMGENVIIGYTQVDNNMQIINGHEITIIGTRIDDSGKLVFICNDTDDNYFGSIEYGEDFLLPKIHHAALPKEVAEVDIHLVENWVEGLKAYKELKRNYIVI